VVIWVSFEPLGLDFEPLGHQNGHLGAKFDAKGVQIGNQGEPGAAKRWLFWAQKMDPDQDGQAFLVLNHF